ncbi:MAG TPA: MazG family protein [Pseudonocardiaceae bacterium]|nr:MazG family protein [Pseudonocardiaceae bacterium]
MSAVAAGPVVITLSHRLGAVLPAAAARLLRDGRPLHADTDVPAELAQLCGAQPVGEDMQGLLLTMDSGNGAAARWVASGAVVLHTPEPVGIALLDAAAVMDRLRSPGGCPWDAEQTHRSLMPYLIEEAYELYQALEDSDTDAVREELGDVLLQVLFHARIAQDMPGGFDIDSVAGDLVTKLVTRHPHVFAGSEEVSTAADQELRWEQLKRTEKRRESSIDGIALGQPAVALVAKLVSRTMKAGLPDDLLPSIDGLPRADVGTGASLFALSAAAKLAGEDPEAALRSAALQFADDVRTAERSARAAGLDSDRLTTQQWREYWPAAPDP